MTSLCYDSIELNQDKISKLLLQPFQVNQYDATIEIVMAPIPTLVKKSLFKFKRLFAFFVKLQRMVFTSSSMLARIPKQTNEFFGRGLVGPDRFCGRRKEFMMSAHFYGRARNCYWLAKRYNLKNLEKA